MLSASLAWVYVHRYTLRDRRCRNGCEEVMEMTSRSPQWETRWQLDRLGEGCKWATSVVCECKGADSALLSAPSQPLPLNAIRGFNQPKDASSPDSVTTDSQTTELTNLLFILVFLISAYEVFLFTICLSVFFFTHSNSSHLSFMRSVLVCFSLLSPLCGLTSFYFCK